RRHPPHFVRPAGDFASHQPHIRDVSWRNARRAARRRYHAGKRIELFLRERGRLMSDGVSAAKPSADKSPLMWIKFAFVRLGVLPFLLAIAVIMFTLMSDNFLTGRNLL